jgi:hypothetical protein
LYHYASWTYFINLPFYIFNRKFSSCCCFILKKNPFNFTATQPQYIICIKQINKFKPLYCMGHTQTWESSSLTAVGGIISLCLVKIKQRKRVIDSRDSRTFKHEPSTSLSTWPLISQSLSLCCGICSSLPGDHARSASLRLQLFLYQTSGRDVEGSRYAAWENYALPIKVILSYVFLAWIAWSRLMSANTSSTSSRFRPYCLIMQVSNHVKVQQQLNVRSASVFKNSECHPPSLLIRFF